MECSGFRQMILPLQGACSKGRLVKSLPKLRCGGYARDNVRTALPMGASQVVSGMAQGTALCHLEQEPSEAEALVQQNLASHMHAGLSASVHACEVVCIIHRW